MISRYKSRGYDERVKPPQTTFRQGLRECLLDARASLAVSEIDPFLQWVNEQISAQLKDLPAEPIGFGELSGVYLSAPVVPLKRELTWIAGRLRANSSQVNNYLSLSSAVGKLVSLGQFSEAIGGLQTIEMAFGASLWGIQLRIALEHLTGGLEQQKRYTAEVRAQHRRGLLGSIAYNTSVRNEDKSTVAKFSDDIKARIERNEAWAAPTKKYMRYRLTGQWPLTQSTMADVLRTEQSHSVIDLYETFISCLQEIAKVGAEPEVCKIAIRSAQSLSEITDFRIGKILLSLGVNVNLQDFSRRCTIMSDELLAKTAASHLKHAQRTLRSRTLHDPWTYFYAGMVFAGCRSATAFRKPLDLARMLGNMLGRGADADDSLAQVSKLALNLSGLPTFVGILDMLPQLVRPNPDSPVRPWLVGLNSPSVGIEDMPPKLFGSVSTNFRQSSATEVVWNRFQRPTYPASPYTYAVEPLFNAAGLFNEQRYEEGVKVTHEARESLDFSLARDLSASMLLHGYSALSDRPKVVEIVAEQVANRSSTKRLMAILTSLEHFTWQDYKMAESPFAACITLHSVWTSSESEAVGSLLRFATGVTLKKLGVTRPSKLFDKANELPRDQLTYFLKSVCVAEVLDVSRHFRTSRDVLEERQAICAVLRQLDPENSEAYQTEVMLISNRLALADGQLIVDRSRMHVDTDSLIRWAIKELSEDFARYRDLLSLNIGSQQNYDDVLKELSIPAPSTRTPFTPETEADTVLVSLVRKIGDEFLNNPTFGFDFYLSKRIRHQSFIGLIRGPLEFSSLITSRASESSGYHRNDFWIDKFSTLDNVSIDLLHDTFTRFASTFDETLTAAKEQSFHVRAPDFPNGRLYLDLQGWHLTFIRAIARMDDSVPEFMETVISLLWAALEPSMVQTRLFISNDIKHKVAGAFDELRASVRKIAEFDPALAEFDMETGARATEVQRALDDVVLWFTRTDIQAAQRIFNLEQIVDIAIDAALKCHRAFNPTISRQVHGELHMSARELVFVHDVLFVALDNISAHSDLKKPKVEVTVTPDLSKGTLTVSVRSDARSTTREANERTLQSIREMIAHGTFERRTKGEGGSGFLKLAAVVRQSDKGRIDFGYLPSGEFELTVVYSLIVHSVEGGVLHEAA